MSEITDGKARPKRGGRFRGVPFLGRFLIILVPFLFVVGWAHMAFAGVAQGIAGYQKGDYANAFNEWRQPARDGDVRAQYGMGLVAYHGSENFKNFMRAAHWFHKAASQDYGPAQYYLGRLYDRGQGVRRNSEKALRWYRRAAKQGETRAQLRLGVIFIKGDGVVRDDRQAHMWFNLAAESGNAMARKYRDRIARRLEQGDLQAARQMAQVWQANRRKPR